MRVGQYCERQPLSRELGGIAIGPNYRDATGHELLSKVFTDLHYSTIQRVELNVKSL